MFHFWHNHYYVKKEYDQCCKTKLMTYKLQWHSRNAEKVTHIKGKLQDQAVILFICVPFKMDTSLKGKNLLPEGGNSFH